MNQVVPDSFVLLITGPAGAGKTTVAAEWARSQAHPSCHVSLDAVRYSVRSGFRDPADGWNEETQLQYDLALTACAQFARLYVAHGFHCAIDDAFFPSGSPVRYDGWRRALRDLPHHAVVLLPTWDVVVERNQRRFDHPPLEPHMLRVIYELMASWRLQDAVPVIDNSRLSIAETIDAISRTLPTAATGESALPCKR